MSLRRRLLHAVFWLAFGSLCAGFARADTGPGHDWDYRLGHGYRFGDSGLALGGYASLRIENYERLPWRAQLSDFSLFTTLEKGHWRFFSELEIGDGLQMGNGEALNTHHAYFDVERLFLDYARSDSLSLRVGKFLTPIGRWNLIHADPLVWTTSRPLATDGPFTQHVTGGMAFGSLPLPNHDWSYALYAGGKNELDFLDPAESVDSAYQDTFGLRLLRELPGRFQLGFSYAHFRQKRGNLGSKNLFGLDIWWTRNRFEVSGEFVYRIADGHARQDDWAVFLQGVAPIVGDLYAVARYEALQSSQADSPSHLWVGGLAFRPIPPLVFKVEYSAGSNNPSVPSEGTADGFSEGFAASVAVLF